MSAAQSKPQDTINRVYVLHFGQIYSFSYKEWQALVVNIVSSGKAMFDISNSKVLQSKPAKVGKIDMDGDGRFHYFSKDKTVKVVADIVEWDFRQWQLEQNCIFDAKG